MTNLITTTNNADALFPFCFDSNWKSRFIKRSTKGQVSATFVEEI